MNNVFFQVTAILTLIPPSLLYFRREPKRDSVFWSAIIVSICGVLLWVYLKQSAGWHTGLSAALWLTISACLIIYIFITIITDEAWRLNIILFPYLLLLGLLALMWDQVPEQSFLGNVHIAWIGTHILVSLGTYGLLTLAALAAFAAMLRGRALKTKTKTKFVHQLPSVAASEKLLVNLLITCVIVLSIGIITGIASLYISTGKLLALDHKTILAFAVFLIVIFIIFIHFNSGIRGRLAMRFVLLAYLLLTLGYPGVKYVKYVLISS
jgi:ABC-type uncharacterized transport system permease subunit